MKGAIDYVAIATVIFSHVKISSVRAKAHLVFHWCLYNNANYFVDDVCPGEVSSKTGDFGIIVKQWMGRNA